VSDELLCDHTYTPSTTETCLLVTLMDQFGDGWTSGDGHTSNAAFQYTTGYANNEYTTLPIRQTLNCSCETVMGCIHPVAGIPTSKSLVYRFNVSSLTSGGALPEYHWEIMWRVQVVEGGVPKALFYGGYDTTLVLDYDPSTTTYTYDDSESSGVWDLSDCTTPTPVSLVSGLTVDGYSITDTDKKTLYSSEDPFCSYTRPPTTAPSHTPTTKPSAMPSTLPSVAPTHQPTVSMSPTRAPSSTPTLVPTPVPTKKAGAPSAPTPSPTVNSVLAQLTASTDLTGVSASEVDQGVQDAFAELTAEALGLAADAINITSITDVSRRRLGGSSATSGRSLTASRARITFTILVYLVGEGFSNGTVAISTYTTRLTTKYAATSTPADLLALAILKGSTTVTTSTVLSVSAPTIDTSFVLIEIKTGTPTMAPGKGSGGDDDDGDTTSIIIGVVVGGTVLLVAVAVGMYFFCFKGQAGKITPN
jgi:hypothetical protein